EAETKADSLFFRNAFRSGRNDGFDCLSNVAALLLVRGVSRQREMAIRKAVGANRFPIARQLLAEGFVLVACGAGAGLILDAFLRDRLTYVRWPSALRFALRVPFPKRQWTISIRVINGI